MSTDLLTPAMDALCAQFRAIRWQYLDVPPGSPREKTQLWPGGPDEDIVVCVARGIDASEVFHRQDFLFFNFAYRGDYDAISSRDDNLITVHEGECYIGQPYAGYAIRGRRAEELIIGVLIRTDAFFRTFLPVLSRDERLFRFFLEPQTSDYADDYIRLRFDDPFSVRSLLEMMVIEYANKSADTQDLLRPMALTLMMLVSRQYRRTLPAAQPARLSDRIVRYMSEHTDQVSLKSLSAHFSYHPNYLSALIHRELGKSFSELLLEQRMERAAALLRGTGLPVEDIAAMLGYADSSNFFKAFRAYYGTSPRAFSEKT